MTEDQPRGHDSAHETSLTYEQARDELADVVRRLEAGSASLEESLALWERGEALATTCEQWLSGVRARLADVAGEGEHPDAEQRDTGHPESGQPDTGRSGAGR